MLRCLNDILKMNKLLIVITSVVLAGMLWSCGNKAPQEESREAKALLQGTWMDEDTEDVLFRMKGDTVYYSDSISMPAYFKVVGDVEIYNLTVDKNRLVFSAPFVENDIIKGEEAYLVIGEPGTYTFTAVKPTEEQINAIPNNENMLFSTGDGRGNSGYSLTAEDMAAAHFEGTKFYKLSIYNNKIGFFWGADKGAAFNYTKPHKAYLAVPPESISNSQSISGFFFDDTTDIREVQGESVAEDATYSISGIRLDGKKLSKGIYIINGKKVVVK